MGTEAKNIFGGLGNTFSIIFFFMPAMIIYDMYKSKDISKVPYLMFIFTLLNCEFWMIYGILDEEWVIWLCNGIGVFTNLIYLSCFLLYIRGFEQWKRFVLVLLQYLTFVLIIVVFLCIFRYKAVVGAIACTMNLFMFLSPMQKIREVYKYKDNSYIPIWISICLTLNCICWVVVGILKDMDFYVMIPNTIGVFFSIVQIVVWCQFNKSEEGNSKKSNYNEVPMDDEMPSFEEIGKPQQRESDKNDTIKTK